ncbi:hypothetical protein F3Y22_tig00116997pilonHSYRG00335 [Hibiscus syriacus]|uniref:RNase H type-1 domain-containing protein n=1 Tax=Hibiscus syriacus TaxID=106335 RepID=A0A6A2WGB9_HIBSY|nr:hypothetical protein F3Y22_tig00116997pilonHSYRG00335 [Hibiscus syriacus]
MSIVPHCVASNFLSLELTDWLEKHINSHLQVRTAFQWQKPPVEWSFLNTEASVSRSGLGSIGGVIRAHEGNWLAGFHKTVGISDALHSELWALYVCLQEDRSLGLLHLKIQSDCLAVVNLFSEGDPSLSHFPLVRAIHRLRQRNWKTSITWIPRECNMLADAIKKLPGVSSYSITLLPSAPHALLLLSHFAPGCFS